MDFVQIEIPFLELTTNEQIKTLAVTSIIGGAKVTGTKNGLTTYTGISNNSNTYSLLTYNVVAYIVSLGGQVLNYQSYIEIDLTDNVPSYIRDFETVNEAGETVNLKWSEWIHINQPPITIDEKIYMSGFSHYAGFRSEEKPLKHLNGTELSALIAGGYNVLNKEQFNNLTD